MLRECASSARQIFNPSPAVAWLHAPWLGLSGFFILAVMLTLLIFIGEAVRDAFDPRKTLQ